MSRNGDQKKKAVDRGGDRPRAKSGRFLPKSEQPEPEEGTTPVEEEMLEEPVGAPEYLEAEPVVKPKREETQPTARVSLPGMDSPRIAHGTIPSAEFPMPVDKIRNVGYGIRDVYDRVNGYLLDVLRANEELTRQSVINQIRIEREQVLQTEFHSRQQEEAARLAQEQARTNQLRLEIESLTSEREMAERVKSDLQSTLSGLKSTITTLQAKNDGLEREVERLKERRDNLERDVARLEKLREEYLETIEKIMARKEALSV